MFESPKGRVPGPTTLSVLVRDTSNANTLLMNADERRRGMQEIERISKLDVLGAMLFTNVKSGADLLHLFFGTKRPETLELGIMKGQADWDDFGKEIDRSQGAVVVVDVINVD
jgi:hypothetical protein